MLVTEAYAQAAGGGAGGAGMLVQFAPFILIFVIMYFLIIRPQRQRMKAHQAMVRPAQAPELPRLATFGIRLISGRGVTLPCAGGSITSTLMVMKEQSLFQPEYSSIHFFWPLLAERV